MQSLSSSSDSSLFAGREDSNADGESNHRSRIIGGGTTHNMSNMPTEDSNPDNYEHELHPEPSNNEAYEAVDTSSAFTVKRLKELYKSHVLDAEKRYHLHFNFCLPTDGEIQDSEFDATPMVLLIGQYSTGKVRALLHVLEGCHSSVPTID